MRASLMSDRYADFRALAQRLSVDAVALVPGANFARLFQANFHTSERPLVVIIPTHGAPTALVPNLELGSFALLDFEGQVFDWRDQSGYTSAFAAMAAHTPLRSVAVEGQVMRVFVHHALTTANPGLKVVDAEREISAFRLCKTPQEIAALERAIAISEAALSEVIARVRVGDTEKFVEQRLIQALFAGGAQALSFHPIVAAADNAARPHAHARDDYALAPGDALLIDFGAQWGGLNADITRTFFIGHATDRAAQVYETVRLANARGHAVAGPSVTPHDIDDAVTGVLEASPFAAFIRTKTGHGLGREVHEAPYIMRGNHQSLAPQMVLTNEPGLYLDGELGVRIEDDVVITPTGSRSLTSFARELTVIG
jgi:Xaa-Pro dipeptidase